LTSINAPFFTSVELKLSPFDCVETVPNFSLLSEAEVADSRDADRHNKDTVSTKGIKQISRLIAKTEQQDYPGSSEEKQSYAKTCKRQFGPKSPWFILHV
jgi:hypothetical protein